MPITPDVVFGPPKIGVFARLKALARNCSLAMPTALDSSGSQPLLRPGKTKCLNAVDRLYVNAV